MTSRRRKDPPTCTRKRSILRLSHPCLAVAIAAFSFRPAFTNAYWKATAPSRLPPSHRIATPTNAPLFWPISVAALCSPLEEHHPEHPLATPPTKASPPFSTAQARLDDWNGHISDLVRTGDYGAARDELRQLGQWMERTCLSQTGSAVDPAERRKRSSHFDAVVQSWTEAAFAADADWQRVAWGVHVLRWRWSLSKALEPPYQLVPKRTLLLALKRLTALPAPDDVWGLEDGDYAGKFDSADAAFRVLQRLVTGVGVRTRTPTVIMEHDFNRVVNAFVAAGRMDRAHAVVALQERTPHAPPVSAVTLSILLKGHGMLRDVKHVERVLQMARSRSIEPDLVMANGLLDAYVNCQALEQARHVFQLMRDEPTRLKTDNPFTLPFPRANGRTYNVFLKGLANAGLWSEASSLAKRMRSLGWWDAITTNTLAHAAIVAGDLDQAEHLLAQYTVIPSMRKTSATRNDQHPNVEAYTELIDAYSKQVQMHKAVAVFQSMRERGVEPNEITFTCLIAGFGRAKQMDQARKMLAFMPTVGVPPSSITYNALISAMVDVSHNDTAEVSLCDSTVDEALRVLRDMIQSGVRPNAVTVATLVTALGNCNPPRVREAKLLVNKLEVERLIPAGSPKVVTSLMQTCGAGGDAASAVEAFRTMNSVDTTAVNVFLDVCCRCGRDRMALDTFEYYFRRKNPSSKGSLKPDTASYSILISFLLNRAKEGSIRRVQKLYNDMKLVDELFPDPTLIDTVLKPMVRLGQHRGLSSDESTFVVSVLRDAEQLRWDDGQLERRKRAIRAVVGSKLRDLWLMDKTSSCEDDLFRRKGWNKVDSGFRLLGLGSDASATEPLKKKVVDRFLESKGWNDVDSGFRII